MNFVLVLGIKVSCLTVHKTFDITLILDMSNNKSFKHFSQPFICGIFSFCF